jgi:hypothetical protein
VNLERTERGLAPAAVLSKSLGAIAQAGAQAGRDTVLMVVVGGHAPADATFTWAKAKKRLGIR